MGSIPIDSRCVRCGFCCKQAPCPWGEWDYAMKQCVCLEEQPDGTYLCGRYAEIAAHIEDCGHKDNSPAFGGGCSSTLFNYDRNRILSKL
jgi:uncharacterized cysteine cluster protein YcgN (CxxCxxCC family)